MPPNAFAGRHRYGSPVAEGFGVDGGRLRERGTVVFCVRYAHACEEASSAACLHHDWAGLLCRANDPLFAQRMPEPLPDVRARTGVDAGLAALADRLGRFLLAGSSPFCSA